MKMADDIGRVRYDRPMLRLTVGISILLVAACAHNRAAVQPDATAAKASGTASGSHAPAPATAAPPAAPGTGASGTGSGVQKTAIKEAFDNLVAGIKKGIQAEAGGSQKPS